MLGANIGIALGIASVPAQAVAVFLRPMQAELGWSRGAISLGVTITIGLSALIAPLIGLAADRVRTHWISAAGLFGLALSLLLFARLGPDLRIYYAGCVAMAVLASGASTVPYARAVSASFVRSRGLALGIAMLGTGISAVVIPILLAPYVAAHGWRQGYVVLGLAVLAAAVAAPVLLMRAPAPKRLDALPIAADVTLRDALRYRLFWTLALTFVLMPLAVGGLGLHMLSFLGDAGISPTRAGQIAGVLGIAQVVARLSCGWLVDRLFAPRVAAALVAVSALFLLGLLLFGRSAVLLGPLAVGIVLGSEIDLVGYVTARYFGLRAYGRIYGLLYACCLIGSSLSIVLYGTIYDVSGGYAAAIWAGLAMLLLCGILLLSLPPFTRAPDRDR